MPEVLNVIMRWLHISSMATLIGGMLYGRLVMLPSLSMLDPQARQALADRASAAYRPWVLTAIAGLVLSGTYNLLSTPGHSARYHTLLGIKFLLVLHVFAVALLIVKPANPRRA